jgi:hypothetical protein
VDLHTIIERQKIGIFVRKIELEWPDCIDYLSWETSQEVFVYLNESLSVSGFVQSLMPKIGMFVDFTSTLIVRYLQQNGIEQHAHAFNFEKEIITLYDAVSITQLKDNALISEAS